MGSLSRDRGRDGEAIRWYRRAVRAAEELGSPLQEVRVRRALALALHRRGRVAEARRELQRAGALARELGASQLEAGVRADVGAMYVEHGDVERGARELEQALAVFEATRDRHWLPITLQNLAEAMRLSGRLAEADAYVRRGLRRCPRPTTVHVPSSQRQGCECGRRRRCTARGPPSISGCIWTSSGRSRMPARSRGGRQPRPRS
jgi:tetratricopeptide (TPR) repeat protein